MCNCGHEQREEADRLKKTAVTSAAGAACLSGIPAMLVGTHGHHALLGIVIGLQCVLLMVAGRGLFRRKQLLRPQAASL